MEQTLTPGAVPRLLQDDKQLQPVVQCIGAKPLTGQNAPGAAPERFRLAISDGGNWCTALPATQLNALVQDGRICNNSILRVTNHLCSHMQGKKIVIILNVELMGMAPSRLGDPKPMFSDAPQAHGQENRPAGGRAPTAAAAHPSNGVMHGNGGQPGAYGPPGGYAASLYGGGPNGAAATGPQQHQVPMNQPAIAGGYGQAPAYHAQNAPVARDEAAPRIVPIASLNAYQNRWTIKARVSQRSELRRWHNARGEGKFFSVDLIDAQGGEIRAVCFNEIADKFDDILQKGKVLLVSKATLKPKKPGSNFNQTRHDHEMTFERATIVEECPAEEQAASPIPQALYRFRKIAEVESCSANTQLDIVAVVESVGQTSTVTKKDGSETFKRNVIIRDDSNKSIELTLWSPHSDDPGDMLENMVETEKSHPIIAIKNARVGDFNGKNLSTIGATLINLNSTETAAQNLRDWYENRGGANMQSVSLSDQRASGQRGPDRRCALAAIEGEHLGSSGQPDYVQVACTVTMIKEESAYYPACSLQYNGRACNKKLTNSDNDGVTWWCDRCQQQAQPDWRYILALQVEDHTDSLWLTAFQEAGTEIMAMPARELRELQLRDGEDKSAAQNHVMTVVHQPFIMKLKIAEETYNGETRIKKTVLRAEKLDFVKESRVLLESILKLSRGERTMQPRLAMGPPGAGPSGFGNSYGGGSSSFAGAGVHGGSGGGFATPGYNNNSRGAFGQGGTHGGGYGETSFHGGGAGGGFTSGTF